MPDGTLLDEAADYIDQSETEIGRMIEARRHDLDEIARLTAENERLHFDYCRLSERKPTEEVDRAWELTNEFSGIAMDALAIARELFQTHPDPYDTGYRLDQLDARYREAEGHV